MNETHLMELGCEQPYRAFTRCGLVVSTLAIVTDRPTCPICEWVYEEIYGEEAA